MIRSKTYDIMIGTEHVNNKPNTNPASVPLPNNVKWSFSSAFDPLGDVNKKLFNAKADDYKDTQYKETHKKTNTETKLLHETLNKNGYTDSNNKPLVVDGNHENFDMLYNLPTVDFCGGVAHKVDDGIYHLIRGEVYNIDEKKFFVFGGASSHDKECRTEGKTWWKEELPDVKEYETAEEKMSSYNYEFDYIITHCAPNSIQNTIAQNFESNE